MAELLQVKDLCAGYGGQDVIRDVSFSLPAGQVCALLGTNGSGKSTLLRAVCGLLPSRGSCRLEGTELAALTRRQRAQKMGYLAQRGGVSLSLSALDVVLMGLNPVLGLLERPSSAQRDRARALLDQVVGSDFAARDFLSLSEGQKQLVLFARTLLRDPPLLVLDEPDSALDLPNRGRLFALLRLTAEEGQGVLLCSHDVNAVLSCAHRLLLMKEGRLIHDLALKSAEPEVLSAALSQIYGPVEVLRHRGHYLMTGGDGQ